MFGGDSSPIGRLCRVEFADYFTCLGAQGKICQGALFESLRRDLSYGADKLGRDRRHSPEETARLLKAMFQANADVKRMPFASIEAGIE
jgi:hypothetical protein